MDEKKTEVFKIIIAFLNRDTVKVVYELKFVYLKKKEPFSVWPQLTLKIYWNSLKYLICYLWKNYFSQVNSVFSYSYLYFPIYVCKYDGGKVEKGALSQKYAGYQNIIRSFATIYQ